MFRVLLLLALVSSVKVQSKPGFLSYADFQGKPYTVTYDKRSFMINGERSMFLGGSLHYPRGTAGLLFLPLPYL